MNAAERDKATSLFDAEQQRLLDELERDET